MVGGTVWYAEYSRRGWSIGRPTPPSCGNPSQRQPPSPPSPAPFLPSPPPAVHTPARGRSRSVAPFHPAACSLQRTHPRTLTHTRPRAGRNLFCLQEHSTLEARVSSNSALLAQMGKQMVRLMDQVPTHACRAYARTRTRTHRTAGAGGPAARGQGVKHERADRIVQEARARHHARGTHARLHAHARVHVRQVGLGLSGNLNLISGNVRASQIELVEAKIDETSRTLLRASAATVASASIDRPLAQAAPVRSAPLSSALR
jgi:hypothetical protein